MNSPIAIEVFANNEWNTCRYLKYLWNRLWVGCSKLILIVKGVFAPAISFGVITSLLSVLPSDIKSPISIAGVIASQCVFLGVFAPVGVIWVWLHPSNCFKCACTYTTSCFCECTYAVLGVVAPTLFQVWLHLDYRQISHRIRYSTTWVTYANQLWIWILSLQTLILI